jgi:exodeoxyribonuclease VII large subunit
MATARFRPGTESRLQVDSPRLGATCSASERWGASSVADMAEARPSEQRHLFALDDPPEAAAEPAPLAERVREVRTAARRTRTEAAPPAPPVAERQADDSAPEPSSGPFDAFDAVDVVDTADEDDAALYNFVEPDEPEALSIADVYSRVRGALAGAFPDEVWVTGEIRSMRESKGHHFFELADAGAPTGRGVAPQLDVACWARQWPSIARALASAGVALEVGRVVRVRGQVSIWEGAGKLRFSLTALDVEALVGGIAAARRRLLIALEAEGLLEANGRLTLTPVPLRIGVVTSPGSEGHHDFVGQLERSGFAFSVHLAPSLVQGPEAPAQLVAALRSLERDEVDLAVVVRGGGARGDLAAFDTEEVARAIATASFPVWTGIGHTGDRSVADEVAHRALITPTACGEAIVALVAEYWQATEHRVQLIQNRARTQLSTAAHLLDRERTAVVRGVHHHLDLATQRLVAGAATVARATDHRLGAALSDVERQAQVLRAFDPRRQLERGWSLTRDASGRLVRSIADLAPGAALSTSLVDGEVHAVVSSTVPNGDAT